MNTRLLSNSDQQEAKFHYVWFCEFPDCHRQLLCGPRHHCRSCGNSICDEHAVENVTLPSSVFNGLVNFRWCCRKCCENAQQQQQYAPPNALGATNRAPAETDAKFNSVKSPLLASTAAATEGNKNQNAATSSVSSASVPVVAVVDNNNDRDQDKEAIEIGNNAEQTRQEKEATTAMHVQVLRSEVIKQAAKLQTLNDELESARSKQATDTAALVSTKQQLSEALTEKGELDKQLQEQSTAASEKLLSTQVALQNEIYQIRAEIHTRKAEQQSLQDKLTAADRDLQTRYNELTALQLQLQQESEAKNALAAQVEALQVELNTLKDAQLQADAVREQVTEEKAALIAQVEALQVELKSMKDAQLQADRVVTFENNRMIEQTRPELSRPKSATVNYDDVYDATNAATANGGSGAGVAAGVGCGVNRRDVSRAQQQQLEYGAGGDFVARTPEHERPSGWLPRKGTAEVGFGDVYSTKSQVTFNSDELNYDAVADGDAAEMAAAMGTDLDGRLLQQELLNQQMLARDGELLAHHYDHPSSHHHPHHATTTATGGSNEEEDLSNDDLQGLHRPKSAYLAFDSVYEKQPSTTLFDPAVDWSKSVTNTATNTTTGAAVGTAAVTTGNNNKKNNKKNSNNIMSDVVNPAADVAEHSPINYDTPPLHRKHVKKTNESMKEKPQQDTTNTATAATAPVGVAGVAAKTTSSSAAASTPATTTATTATTSTAKMELVYGSDSDDDDHSTKVKHYSLESIPQSSKLSQLIKENNSSVDATDDDDTTAAGTADVT